MAETTRTTVKSWFKRKFKPTQEQFWNWMDSIWFKHEKIPYNSVDGLDQALIDKADDEKLTNHIGDTVAHVTAEEKASWAKKTELDNYLQIDGDGSQLTNVNATTLGDKNVTDFIDTSSNQYNIGGFKTFELRTVFNGGALVKRLDLQPSTAISISGTYAGLQLDNNGYLMFNTPNDNTTNFAFNNSNLTTKRIYSLPDGSGYLLLSNGDGSQLTNVNAITLGGKNVTDFVDKTSNETITGTKSFNTGSTAPNIVSNVSIDDQIGLSITNTAFTVGMYLKNEANGHNIFSQNDVDGNGMYSINNGIGNNFYSENGSTGTGFFSNNTSTGEGIVSENFDEGIGISSLNTSTGIGIKSSNSGAGNGIVSDSNIAATGYNYVGQNQGTNTFTVDKLGNVDAEGEVYSKAMVVDPLGTTSGIAGSNFTVKKKSTSTSTNASQFIDVDRQASSTPSNTNTNTFGLVARVVNNSTVEDAGVTGSNLVGRNSSSSNFNFAYGTMNTGEASGSGNGNFVVGTSNDSKVTGAATIDYLRGISSTTTINNAGATVNYMQGEHNSLVFTNGSVGDASVIYLDVDGGSATVTGNLAYIRAGNDALPTVSGNAYFIKSESVLPSEFSGSIQTTQYKLSALNTAPSSSTDTGNAGEIRYTTDYIYVCVATNTWKRSALSTW